MKRLSFVILALLMVGFMGCATTPNGEQQDTVALENAAITIAARSLAFYVGRNNTEIIEPGIAFCSAFAGEDVDLRPLLAEGLKYLDKEVDGYPLMEADLMTLLELLDIAILDRDVPLTDRQKEMVRIAAGAFGQGLEIAKEVK